MSIIYVEFWIFCELLYQKKTIEFQLKLLDKLFNSSSDSELDIYEVRLCHKTKNITV